jgi:AcrR family transcriptional regulator
MARLQPEIRKQELIQIAFRQFLELGYAKTSIRSIVGEADGEIGMFYHHFASKEEIFKEVLETYNQHYIQRMENIIRENKNKSFIDLLDKIFVDLENTLYEYANLNRDSIDTQMLIILHHQTLTAIHPLFCDLLTNSIQRQEIYPPTEDINLLADFILYGISAIIHDREEKDIKVKEKAIKELVQKLLVT